MEIVESQANMDNANWFIEFVTNMTTIWSFLGIFLIIVLSATFLIRLKSRLNKDSLKQVSIFEREKKYMKELYIELNETQETLRYFAFSSKWKLRIINIFNSLFNDSDGKKLKAKIKLHRFKLSRLTSAKRLSGKLEEYKNHFDALRKQRGDLREELGDYNFALERSAYTYGRKIEKLASLDRTSHSSSLLLIGNAGNGKTNTLCGFVNLLIKNNYPCMFINAKDVKDSNCFDYFIKKLKIPEIISSFKGLYLFATDILLLFRRKYLIVIIDAINENDHHEFIESLGEFIDNLCKYKRVKVLMSCRSEYFVERYKQFFDSCYTPPMVINTSSLNYGERAKKQILQAYSKHFNFQGRISSNAKRNMFRSLILMRIFFEVYENRNDVVVELNNYKIYQEYINKLTLHNSKINLQAIINNMVDHMVDNSEYSGVGLSDLNIDNDTFIELQKILDNNFLISKSVIENKGLITEDRKEYLYFVFDELRDFCISKYLLQKGGNDNYEELFSICTSLYDNRKSPLEGILKYSYIYFKNVDRFDLCQYILDQYCNEPIHYWKYNEDRRWPEKRSELFHNFGITIIFNNIENVLDFERSFLLNACKKNNHDFCQMFFYFLANELEGVSPNPSFLIDLIGMIENIADFKNMFNPFSNDWEERHYREEERIISQVYEFLKRIQEKNKAFSVGTQQFILLIYVADPTKYMFDEFLDEIITEETVFKLLLDRILIDEVKDELLAIKKQHNQPKKRNDNIIEWLHQLLKMGEESNAENR